MDQIKLTKNNVIKTLNSSTNLQEELNSFFKNILKVNKISEEIKNTYLYRAEHISEFLRAINKPNQNLYLLGGFQGTGKTTFLKAISLTLDSNVLFFHYECSIISNLDDIILALNNYLEQFSFKESKTLRQGKTNQAIDEKLMAILNILDRPLIIAFDNFENILKEYSDIRDADLKNFLDFLLSINNVKIILAGKKIPVASFHNANEPIFTIRLGGLEYDESSKILENSNITDTNYSVEQVCDSTRGYPESLKLLAITSIQTKLSINDILKEFSNSEDSFENYTFQQIYKSIPDYCKELINFFAIVRHPITAALINKLNSHFHINDIEGNIEYLNSLLLLAHNNNGYYIKEYFKNIIYAEIADAEKAKLHNILHELYKEQVEKPLKDRSLNLSKNLMYSEKYYHYGVLGKLKKKQKPDSPQQNPKLMSSYYSNKYDLTYLPQNVNEILIVNSNKEDPKKTAKKEQDATKNDIVKNKIIFHNQNKDFDGLEITLTEEEKQLLDEEIIYEGQILNEESTTKEKKATSSFDNIEDDLDNNESSQIFKNEHHKAAQYFENQKNYELAIESYKKACNFYVDTKEYSTVAKLTLKIADLYEKSNKPENTIEYLLKALGLFTNINDNHSVVMIIYKIAEINNQRYKHEIALKYYYMLLNTEFPVPEDIENKALAGIGDIYNYRKDYKLALKFYGKAYDRIKYYDDIESKCGLCFKIALIYDEIDELEKAVHFYKKTLDISENPKLNQFLSSTYTNMAIIYEGMSQKTKAIHYYTKSLEADTALNFFEGQYKTLSILSNIYLEENDKKNAVQCLMKGIETAGKSGDKYCIAMSYLDIGDYYLSQKIYPNAIIAFIKAKKAIGQVISTDSKEKIDRRFKQIIMEIGEKEFNHILESFRKQNEK